MSKIDPIIYQIRELNIDIIPPMTKDMYTDDKGGSKIIVFVKT